VRRSGVEQLSAEVPDAILERRRGFFGEAADPELEDVAIAEEFVGRAYPLDLSTNEEREPVTVLDEVGGDVGGEDDGGATRSRGLEEIGEDRKPGSVEARGGLIEEDHLGLIQEGLGEPEAPVHSPGVGPNGCFAGAVQAHADQHLLDAVPPARGGHAREGGEQVKDAPGGELGREGGSVREEGEAAADRPRGGGVAEDLDPASARSIHPGEEAEERGLSGAVRADDPQRLARVDAQVDLVERLAPSPAQASAEYPAQPHGLDGELGSRGIGRGVGVGGGAGHGFLPESRASPATIRRMARLFVLSGASIGATHDIEGTTVLGRGGDADVVIPESSVSRRHARLTPQPEPGVWKIRDLKSSNGVHVGGKRVEEAPVHDGETFLLGDVELRLRDEPAAEEASTRSASIGSIPSGSIPSGSADTTTSAAPPPELEYEDEIVLPEGAPGPQATLSGPGPALPEGRVSESSVSESSVAGDRGEDEGSEVDSERLRAARARAANERAARRAAVLEGPASAPPTRDATGGGGQILQYAQHRRGDDLSQLPGWKRLALGLLALGLAVGVAYGAFELTRTAREQAAAIGD